MRRPSRLRRIAKWLGTTLCALVVTLFAYSSPWLNGSHAWGLDSINTMITMADGGIGVVRYERPAVSPDAKIASFVAASINRMPKWTYKFVWWPETVPFTGGMEVSVPLWMLLGLFLVPTAFLWWRDRTYPKGHCCQCGYDLTGNVSGVCPECGCGT